MRKIIFAFGLLLAACGAAPDDLGLDVGSTSQPIINGQAPNRPEHAAVVSLHLKYVNANLFNPNPFCSGTLVDDDWVLTAAHCVNKRKASTLAVSTSDNPAVSFVPTRVSEVHVNPAYDSARIRNDIALLRLSQPIAGTTVPALPASLGFTQADVDSALNLNFAGFGYSDLAKTQIGVKLQVDQPLGGLGCSVPGCPSGMPVGTQISYVQDPDGPCNGDSGGPAFVDRGGVWYVGGVTSYGDGSCAKYGASTNASAFEAWIQSYLNPPPSTCSEAGASCTANADCCSGSCGGKPGKKTCR